MVAAGRTAESAAHVEMLSLREQLRSQATLLSSLVLLAGGILVMWLAPQFPSLRRGVVTALSMYVLAFLGIALRRRRPRATAWGLVIACIPLTLVVAVQTGARAAVNLLIVPVSLAALASGAMAGVLTALVCSLMLLAGPPLAPADGMLRVVALGGIWVTVAFSQVTLHPLMTALEWSWSSYEQSRRSLERARDTQMHLKQALHDLSEANLQLARLNRLALALRQAAEEARAAKEQFVANVSHELRTPLNMIIGFSEMIVHAPQIYSGGLPSDLLADLEVILRNGRHLSSLIDDILDLSQIEAGQMALTKERLALPEVIQDAATAVRPLFESKGLYLETEIAPDLPLVMCDRTRVRAVLLNLLSNAGRFTQQGGVHIRAYHQGGQVAISIADTGPGISPRARERLFEPFQQLDGSIRRLYGGTGLGLSISKKFVELHGGRIWVEGEEGAGATFTFTLPVDPPVPLQASPIRWLSPSPRHEAPPQRAEATAPPVRSRLVVQESQPTLRRLFNRFLDRTEIVSVDGLEEALAELGRVPAQALVVNALSVADSLQQLLQMERLPAGVPVIVCCVPGTDEAAATLGVSGYLLKPISREALLAALDRLQLGKRATILVVDDEPESARLVQRMLNAAERDYRVLRALDGRHALNLLRSQHPDAILLDLMMPEMDGFRLLESRSQEPLLQGIPVIVVSARDPAGKPVVSRALAVTRADGLTAPDLLACVQSLTGILSRTGQAGDPAPPTAQPG